MNKKREMKNVLNFHQEPDNGFWELVGVLAMAPIIWILIVFIFAL